MFKEKTFEKGSFMKKNILKGIACIFAIFMLFSCVSAPSATSFKGADAASGSTFRVGEGVTIKTFDGEAVNWTANYTLTGWKTAEFYVPEGLHNFVATAGFLTQEFNIAFTPGKRYYIWLSLNKTNIIFEEL